MIQQNKKKKTISKFRNITRFFGNYVAIAVAEAAPTTVAVAVAEIDAFTLQRIGLEVDIDDEDVDDIPPPLLNKVENIAAAGSIQLA